MPLINPVRHPHAARVQWVVMCAAAGALFVGAIADTVTGTFTTVPYQLGALAGALYALLTDPD